MVLIFNKTRGCYMAGNILDVFESCDLTNEKIDELISNKKTFVIKNIPSSFFDQLLLRIEKSIEDKSMKCRVYTEYRSAIFAAMTIPTGVTQIIGIASAIGVGIHNLVTYNPDYELAKNLTSTKLGVIYKK